MKRITKLLILASMTFLFSSTTFANSLTIPVCVKEPIMGKRLSWNVSPNGLLNVSFDLNGDGISDYHTVRVILRHYESGKSLHKIKNENSDNLIFFVKNTSSNYYYFTAKQPLFYAFDVDGDGFWDLTYKDVLEDGVNGNEIFHDSPSGMFANK